MSAFILFYFFFILKTLSANVKLEFSTEKTTELTINFVCAFTYAKQQYWNEAIHTTFFVRWLNFIRITATCFSYSFRINSSFFPLLRYFSSSCFREEENKTFFRFTSAWTTPSPTVRLKKQVFRFLLILRHDFDYTTTHTHIHTPLKYVVV